MRVSLGVVLLVVVFANSCTTKRSNGMRPGKSGKIILNTAEAHGKIVELLLNSTGTRLPYLGVVKRAVRR